MRERVVRWKCYIWHQFEPEYPLDHYQKARSDPVFVEDGPQTTFESDKKDIGYQ